MNCSKVDGKWGRNVDSLTFSPTSLFNVLNYLCLLILHKSRDLTSERAAMNEKKRISFVKFYISTKNYREEWENWKWKCFTRLEYLISEFSWESGFLWHRVTLFSFTKKLNLIRTNYKSGEKLNNSTIFRVFIKSGSSNLYFNLHVIIIISIVLMCYEF